jgi:RNA polymerase sigma-70 factor (ECF subfamily)
MDDNIIIRKCLAGDREIFEVLVNKYKNLLFSFAKTIISDHEDTVDIVQDSFVTAFTSLNKFNPEKNFKTWIMSITYNKCIDHTRRRKIFLKYFDKLKKEYKEKTFEKKQYENIEDSNLFKPALKKLSNKERSALAMQLNLNMTADEIGNVLNCSLNTVRVHLFNARSKIKKIMTSSMEPLK